MKKKKNTYPLYKAVWLDATAHTDESLQDLLSKPTKCWGTERRCVGWLVKEDEHGIIMANDLMKDSCDFTFIPKQMLLKKTKIRR